MPADFVRRVNGSDATKDDDDDDYGSDGFDSDDGSGSTKEFPATEKRDKPTMAIKAEEGGGVR